MPAIYEVAKQARVSTATVSRILNRQGAGSPSTRRRVMQAVERLSYTPNSTAANLRTLRTGKLLVTVPDIANPFFSLILQGIEDAAQHAGYAVLLGDTHDDKGREERYIFRAFSGRSLKAIKRKIADRGRGMKKLIVVVAVAALFDVALATAPDDKWWPDFGGNAANSHFVDVDEINKSNVGQLEVAWFYPYGQTGFNPIVVDGVMYVLGRNNSLIALDPTSGKEIWIHEKLNGITSRGINYWRSPDGKNRRLIFAING